MNTARAWTIAWAVMNGVELNPRLPAAFVKKIEPLGYPNRALLDAMHWSEEYERNQALDAVERVLRGSGRPSFPV